MATQQNNGQEQDLNHLRKVRREKLAELQANGQNPFEITKYDVTHHSQEVKDNFDELEGKLIRQRRKKVQIRTEIREKIEELDNEKEKDVLTKRYIDCEGWNRICDETGYKWTQVHRNHSEALKKFKMV